MSTVPRAGIFTVFPFEMADALGDVNDNDEAKNSSTLNEFKER
jgi:hypothetical protein